MPQRYSKNYVLILRPNDHSKFDLVIISNMKRINILHT